MRHWRKGRAMTVHATDPGFRFDNSYARLPERFGARLPPTPVAAPRLIRLNDALARHLGLDPEALATAEGVSILAGNTVPDGAQPMAMAYAGHQFGGFVPQLGDGRAILLGEVIDGDGVRRDIQLKGAGKTPFSRMGDGRAGLGPVLREYVVSEAMFALGIPTTRALAAVETGEPVVRERVLPGAILTRVARSHIRVGTFEYFAARRDDEGLALLLRHVIERHDPEAEDAPLPARAFLDGVVARQARLVARWLSVGFIHGVMNTDNTSIAGETIDYGPCAFMDDYHPGRVYSSIDQGGRYAFGNQPRIMHWNLAVLAQTLLPLMGEDEETAVKEAQESIDAFPDHFDAAYRKGLGEKLGLTNIEEGDADLADALLSLMADNKADFTLTFRGLSALSATPDEADDAFRTLFDNRESVDDWLARWRQRLGAQDASDGDRQAAMKAVNPAFIPRNHLVEEALEAAQHGNLAPFDELTAVLAKPFDDQPGKARFAEPPRPEEVVRQTFCGT